MQRADDLNIKRCGLFQQILHLHTVLADDAEIISASLASPVLINVQRAEFAEAVCREKRLVLSVIGNHYLGPVHHRRENECQLVRAERKALAVLYYYAAVGVISAKKVLYHCESLGVANYLRFGVLFGEFRDVCRMVRLHVLNYEIIRLSAAQRLLEVREPLFAEMRIYRIHNGGLFVEDNIRIVSHSVRNNVLSLKKIDLMVIHADVNYVLCNFHHFLPPVILYLY